jgi:hypothetical protein
MLDLIGFDFVPRLRPIGLSGTGQIGSITGTIQRRFDSKPEQIHWGRFWGVSSKNLGLTQHGQPIDKKRTIRKVFPNYLSYFETTSC